MLIGTLLLGMLLLVVALGWVYLDMKKQKKKATSSLGNRNDVRSKAALTTDYTPRNEFAKSGFFSFFFRPFRSSFILFIPSLFLPFFFHYFLFFSFFDIEFSWDLNEYRDLGIEILKLLKSSTMPNLFHFQPFLSIFPFNLSFHPPHLSFLPSPIFPSFLVEFPSIFSLFLSPKTLFLFLSAR